MVITIILALALVASLVNCFVNWLAARAIAYWVVKKGLKPTDADIRQCAKDVIALHFGIHLS